MAGWEELGDLLGGGQTARSEQAFQQGRYRSAQTEDALANARVAQAKAIRAQTENDADTALRAQQEAGQLDYANPTSALITNALLGGRAGNLPNIGNYNLQAQELRNRNVLGDTAAPAVSRLRAGEAVQGKVQGDIQGVTGKASYNLTDDTPELATMAGVDGGSTPADLQFYDRLMSVGGPDTPQGRIMMEVRRNQYKTYSDGGVPTQVRFGNTPEITPLNTPAGTANNAAIIGGATAGAKTTATTQSKLQSALPGVMETLDTFNSDIDRFTASDGFDMVYGKSGAAAGVLGPLAPEEYRNAKTLLANLNSQAFINSIQKMRGLGQLSNAEGSKVESALTAALDPNQDEAQAAQSFKLLKQRLDRFRRVAEIEAGMKAVPGVTIAPGVSPPAAAPPAAAPPSFATEAEAEAAGIAPGTRVVIGGVSGVWE